MNTWTGPDEYGLYTDIDGFIANYPFDLLTEDTEHWVFDWMPKSPKKRCTCGAASIGYKEKGPAHSSWCDTMKEVSVIEGETLV